MLKQKFKLNINDNKGKTELLLNCKIEKTNPKDIYQIVDILQHSFCSSKESAIRELFMSNVDLYNSVKLVDKRDNMIYGILLFSHFSINDGSPLLAKKPFLADYLNDKSQLNGYAFIIDERFKNSKIDKKMLHFQKEYIEQFDCIWCGVETNVNSHSYWEKLGFLNILDIPQAKFYIKPLNKKTYLDIFIIETMNRINDNNII